MNNVKKVVSILILIVFVVLMYFVLTKTPKNDIPKLENQSISVSENKISSAPVDVSAQSFDKEIMRSALLLRESILSKDYEKFSQYTYPKFIEMMGGRENYIKISKQLMPEGFEIVDISIDNPSKIIKTNAELQTTLETSSKIKTPKGLILSKSTLIAISSDNGKTWYFLDTSGKTAGEMRGFFSNISNELTLPEKTDPVFLEN